MIHVYSGDGRGKTSIAVGTVIRMAGCGNSVIFAQFMKGGPSGEINILKKMSEVTILREEKEYPFFHNMSEQDKESIRLEHNKILEKIMNEISYYKEIEDQEKSLPKCLIVLDEITYPVQYGLIDTDLLKKMVNELPANVELIMTGRNPSEWMLEACDYWSQVQMKRHPYEKGVFARYGVEY